MTRREVTDAFTDLDSGSRYMGWLVAALLARLPITMTLVVLVWAAESAGYARSFGIQLAGVSAVALGMCGYFWGCVFDRLGVHIGLRAGAIFCAVVLVAEAFAFEFSYPSWVLYLLAAAQGASQAGFPTGFRVLLPLLFRAERLTRLNAVDIGMTDIAYVVGPLLATLAAGLIGPPVTLVSMAACVLFAACLLPRKVAAGSSVRGNDGLGGAGAIVSLLGLVATIGMITGLLQAGAEQMSVHMGQGKEWFGWLTALLALGSACGGFITMAVSSRVVDGVVRKGPPVLFAAIVGLLLVGAIADDPGFSLAILPLVGLCEAPVVVLVSLVILRSVEPSRRARFLAAQGSALLVAIGLGNYLGGTLPAGFDGAWVLTLAAIVALAGVAQSLRLVWRGGA